MSGIGHSAIVLEEFRSVRIPRDRFSSEIGSQIWKTLVYVVFALLLIEALLAKVFGSRRGALKRN